MHNYLSTHLYWSTYPQTYPKVNQPVYLNAFLPANHKDLPVTSTTHLHTNRFTCSSPYLFFLILPFQQTANTYLSSHLLFYISTELPIHSTTHSSTYLVISIIFSIWLNMHTYLSTHLLVCILTDPFKMSLPVDLYVFILANSAYLRVHSPVVLYIHSCIC